MRPVIGFDPEGARLVVKATREAMRRPKGRVPTPKVPRLVQPIRYAKVTTAIKPGTASGPGRGAATLVPCTYDDNDDATYGAPSDPYPCYNFDTSTGSAVGALVIVAVMDGRLHMICELCPASSSGSYSGGTSASPTGGAAPGFDAPGFAPGGES